MTNKEKIKNYLTKKFLANGFTCLSLEEISKDLNIPVDDVREIILSLIEECFFKEINVFSIGNGKKIDLTNFTHINYIL